MERHATADVGESVSIGELVDWSHGRLGNKNSTAQLDNLGTIRAKLAGTSPRQEEDSLETCARLVRVLNAMGSSWSEPIEGDAANADADGLSVDVQDRKKTLRIQVVRASSNETMWRTLSQRHEVEVEADAEELADELLVVIKKKQAHYPAREDLTLAIDANRLPAHTYDVVIDSFHRRHRELCAQCGFRDVWLVGPRDELVVRLDA